MKKSWLKMGLGLALALGGCGEGGARTLCEVLLPLVAVSVPQSTEGTADYCIECTVAGETYLIVRSSYEGIAAVAMDSGLQDGCGAVSLSVGPTVPVGDYLYRLSPYRVGEHSDDGPADAGGDETLTLTVTGEDCGNGDDDDDDGGVDCLDLDNCAPTPACQGGGG